MPDPSSTLSSPTGRLPAVDRLKLLACFSVVCIHTAPLSSVCPTASAVIVWVCRLAVPVFFVLAGYSFQNRLSRDATGHQPVAARALGPPARYYGYFVLWSLLYVLKPPFADMRREGLVAGFIQGVAPKVSEVAAFPTRFLIEGYGGHLWFLPALAASLVGLWLAECRRARRGWIAAMAGLYMLSVVDGAYAQTPLGLSLPLNTRNGLFIGGLAVALGAWLRRANVTARPETCFWAAGVLGVLYAAEAVGAHMLWNVRADQPNVMLTTVPLAASVVGLALSRPPRPASPWLEPAARTVFGIYLVHVFVIHPVMRVLERGGSWVRDTLTAPAVFALSAFFVLAVRRVPVLRRGVP